MRPFFVLNYGEVCMEITMRSNIDFTAINYADKESLTQLISTGKFKYKKILHGYAPDIYLVVDSIDARSFPEKMYIYLHGKVGCKRCGENVTFLNVLHGYRDNCKACYEYMRKVKEPPLPPRKCEYDECQNPVLGVNAHTGRWNVYCSLKCRGIHNSLKSREKTREVWKEKYGYDHHRKSPEMNRKYEETMMERHGTTNLMKVDGSYEKMRQTNLERYGSYNLMDNQGIKDKIKKTTLERYGVENVSQNKEIHRKKLRSSKQYALPNGKVITVQGYEPAALDLLSRVMVIDESIIDVPTINYIDKNGKDKVYFPDFKIEINEKPTLIEVKSTYTVLDVPSIINKMLGSVNAGYGYALMLMDHEKMLDCVYFDSGITNKMATVPVSLKLVAGRYLSQYGVADSTSYYHPFFLQEGMCDPDFIEKKKSAMLVEYGSVSMFNVGE